MSPTQTKLVSIQWTVPEEDGQLLGFNVHFHTHHTMLTWSTASFASWCVPLLSHAETSLRFPLACPALFFKATSYSQRQPSTSPLQHRSVVSKELLSRAPIIIHVPSPERYMLVTVDRTVLLCSLWLVCRAGSFLSTGQTSAADAAAVLRSELAQNSDRVLQIEADIQATFSVLPTVNGRIGHQAVSYLLHRLFVRSNGWVHQRPRTELLDKVRVDAVPFAGFGRAEAY